MYILLKYCVNNIPFIKHIYLVNNMLNKNER